MAPGRRDTSSKFMDDIMQNYLCQANRPVRKTRNNDPVYVFRRENEAKDYQKLKKIIVGPGSVARKVKPKEPQISKGKLLGKEDQKKLDSRKREIINGFLNEVLVNPGKYGEIGSDRWIHHLVKKLRVGDATGQNITQTTVEAWLQDPSFAEIIERLEFEVVVEETLDTSGTPTAPSVTGESLRSTPSSSTAIVPRLASTNRKTSPKMDVGESIVQPAPANVVTGRNSEAEDASYDVRDVATSTGNNNSGSDDNGRQEMDLLDEIELLEISDDDDDDEELPARINSGGTGSGVGASDVSLKTVPWAFQRTRGLPRTTASAARVGHSLMTLQQQTNKIVGTYSHLLDMGYNNIGRELLGIQLTGLASIVRHVVREHDNDNEGN